MNDGLLDLSPTSTSSERPNGTATFGRSEGSPKENLAALDGARLVPRRGVSCRITPTSSYEVPMNSDRHYEFEDPYKEGTGEKKELSFAAWPNVMLRNVLAAKTPFSFFVMQCLRLCRGVRDDPSDALFPIPLPPGDCWGVDLKHLGCSRRARRANQRILYLAVAALNFTYFKHPLSQLKELWRRPGPCHLSLYSRLIALIKACGPSSSFSALSCGRKSHHLSARLEELHGALQSLGVESSSFYCKQHEDSEVPLDNSKKEELKPYRCLDASRLKLSGRGQWDCRPFLSDLLYMPFVEPQINMFEVTPPASLVPDLSGVSREEVVRLCKVWDVQGLLQIHPNHLAPEKMWRLAKVFNNYKSPTADRQIGDRRGQNFCEGKISDGPSHSLPTAASLLAICPTRYQESLVGSIADRRDFYHQFWVTPERSKTNAMYPPLTLDELEGTNAAADFIQSKARKRPRLGREEIGDNLHAPTGLLCESPTAEVLGCFGALFQGDHLGVEFATDAHSSMLASYGLMCDSSRLQGFSAIQDDRCVSGLVIDDFFTISREAVRGDENYEDSASVSAFIKAKAAYLKEGLIGSDDKDVVGSSQFKVCGGEVDSSASCVKRGVCSLGAPYDKRMALAHLSAAATRLPYTSDALHSCLVGSWISTLLLRRPAMSLLDEVFKVIPPADLDTDRPTLRHLPRRAADELLVLSCMAPILASNLAVPFSEEIFATDASMAMGGVASTCVSTELAQVLWRSAERKKPKVPVLTRAKAILVTHDEMFEEEALHDDYGARDRDADGFCGLEASDQSPSRPIGLMYEFLEVCGGAGVVTRDLLSLGVNCGPVLDLSFSKQYDLRSHRVLEWVFFLLEEDRLQSVLLSPPCTSFSAAAYPSVRSYKVPRGYDQTNWKVKLGNQLAFACMSIFAMCLRLGKFALLEQPRRSKMRWLAEWQRLIALGATEMWLASCMYGSQHQKEFVFLGANMHHRMLHRACSKDHSHVRIQGSYTKASSTYCPGLSFALARLFADHLAAWAKAVARLGLKTVGLEDLLTNDVCASRVWRQRFAWWWRSSSHINVLEMSAVVRLLRELAKKGGDQRITVFIDSHVVLSCLVRGRSSSDSLRSLLRKVCALSIGFGLYVSGRFAPTRLNPADHPSRSAPIPPPCPFGISQDLDVCQLHRLSTAKALRRWISNWSRLTLLLCPALLDLRPTSGRLSSFPVRVQEWTLDFDSTLGYPGEGPQCVFGGIINTLVVVVLVSGAPDQSHGDAARAKSRAGIVLEGGRRVTEATSATREVLFDNLLRWMTDQGVSGEDMIFASPPDLDGLNSILVRYGKWLFNSGKPYYHFSETINAVTSKRPLVRRSLQQVWDLAFMWGSYEPVEHHIAMPHQVLCALIAGAWYWGWVREAAVFALAWGALLRIGEILAAFRSDLILPSDVLFTIDHALLKVSEPKTRFRAARHQCGKLEHPDLLEVVRVGFERLRPTERLWPFSGSTLRSRLTKLLVKLGLPSSNREVPRPLSLASFRPGGATYMISVCDNSEQVRRRGRWASHRIMEIYLQEVASTTYLNQVSEVCKQNIINGMHTFPTMLQQVIHFHACSIPASTWYFLWQKQS